MTAIDEPTKLMQRLEHGYMLINEANDTGDLILKQSMEDHWITLLHQYEAAVGLEWFFPEHHERIAERSAA